MGKFLNTDMKVTIDNITQGSLDRLSDNNFYKFNDKKPTLVTFYNPNLKESTLDEGSLQAYSDKGSLASIRFDKIEDAVVYGLGKIEVDLEVGDFGLESNEITGEAVIPPNTFTPYPNAYFVISHLEKHYTFKVTKTSVDTLETGANFHKFEYNLEGIGEKYISDLENRTVKSFHMIADNIGTNIKSVILSNEYDEILKLEDTAMSLKEKFQALYFQEVTQSYVYKYQGCYMYDPMTIEFIIRNKILKGLKESYFVTQSCYLPPTFRMDYELSLYYNIEKQNPNIILKRHYGEKCEDPMSLLTKRLEPYYLVTTENFMMIGTPIEIHCPEVTGAILRNEKFDGFKTYANLIGNYFHKDNKAKVEKFFDEYLQTLFSTPDYNIYHILPILIYIIEDRIRSMIEVKNHPTKERKTVFD